MVDLVLLYIVGVVGCAMRVRTCRSCRRCSASCSAAVGAAVPARRSRSVKVTYRCFFTRPISAVSLIVALAVLVGPRLLWRWPAEATS
jgi:hypothetical protein